MKDFRIANLTTKMHKINIKRSVKSNNHINLHLSCNEVTCALASRVF